MNQRSNIYKCVKTHRYEQLLYDLLFRTKIPATDCLIKFEFYSRWADILLLKKHRAVSASMSFRYVTFPVTIGAHTIFITYELK